jgi:hypothetical protein
VKENRPALPTPGICERRLLGRSSRRWTRFGPPSGTRWRGTAGLRAPQRRLQRPKHDVGEAAVIRLGPSLDQRVQLVGETDAALHVTQCNARSDTGMSVDSGNRNQYLPQPAGPIARARGVAGARARFQRAGIRALAHTPAHKAGSDPLRRAKSAQCPRSESLPCVRAALRAVRD